MNLGEHFHSIILAYISATLILTFLVIKSYIEYKKVKAEINKLIEAEKGLQKNEK